MPRPGYPEVALLTGFPSFLARRVARQILAAEPSTLLYAIVRAKVAREAEEALLELPKEGEEGLAERSFAALRETDVVNGQTHRALRRAQRARKQIEHSYVRVPAGKVHEAAILINGTAESFIRAYRIWISELL